jgi:membrane protease YdiL (CAAX protease family)
VFDGAPAWEHFPMPVRFDIFTVAFLLWTALVMPLLAYLGARRISAGKPLRPKLWRMRVNGLLLVMSGLLALAAAQTNHLSLHIHFVVYDALIGAALALVLVSAAAKGMQRAKPEVLERRRKLHWPENAAQWRWAMAISAAAGIGEELEFRGALYQLLLRLALSIPTAVVICVTLFALAHLAHGRRATLAIAYIGLVFHVLFLVTGNLLVTIVLHTAYDMGIFSVMYWRRAMLVEPAAEATTAPQVEVHFASPVPSPSAHE